MSREQLLDLASELDRLLAAGARSAAGSDALRRRAKVVDDLSAKVPALVPLKEAIDRVLTAPAKDAPAALLDLLAKARLMRAGLAESTVPGEIGTVLGREGCQTPLPAKRAHELYDNFVGGDGGKHAALEEAIQKKEINDLRLQRVLVDSLDDKDAGFADEVADKALPLLGKAVLSDLLATLDLAEGDAGDARRLKAICRIDKSQGADLARKALKEGSQKVLVEALELLPEVVPVAEAEKVGVEFAQDKRAPVRAAALKSLVTSKDDAALALVVEKVGEKSNDVSSAALEVLGKLAHPKTADRIMERARDLIDNLTVVPKRSPTRKKKAATGAKKPAKKAAKPAVKKLTDEEIGKLQQKRWEELNRAQALLYALAQRPDLARQAVADFAAPLMKHKEYQVSNPARMVLLAVGPTVPDALPMLKKLIETSNGWMLNPVVEMIKKLPAKDRVVLLPSLLQAATKGYVPFGVAQGLFEMLREHAAIDPKPFADYLERALKKKEPWLWNLAVTQLLAMETADSTPYLAAALDGYLGFGNSYYTPGYDDLLKLLRRDEPDGKRSVARIGKTLAATKKTETKLNLLKLLAEFGPVAAPAKKTVEGLVKDRKKEVKAQAAKTLEAIAAT